VGFVDLPCAEQADAVELHKHHHRHTRVIHLLTVGMLLAVSGVDLDEIQIQFGSQIQQKEHQMVILQPVHL
jgi:hypothetical protein